MRMLATIVLVLSVSLTLGGLLKTGSIGYADGTNSWQTVIPLAIFFYLLLIAGLTFMGFNLKRHELVVIPLVGALIILFFFTKAFNPSYEISTNAGSLESDQQIDLSSTITSVEATTSTVQNITFVSTSLSPESTFSILDPLTIFIFALFTSILFAILAFLYSRSVRREFKIQFAEEQKYRGVYNEFQKSIMEIYVQLSYKLEARFGRAPKWYTPTRFSSEIQRRAFETLAQNWEQMTELYERARFGCNAVYQEEVELAKELELQIIGLLQKIDEMEDGN